MNENSSVIIALCSHLCANDCNPLTPSEWSRFAKILVSNKLQPKDVTNFSDNEFKHIFSYTEEEISRFKKLFNRSGSLTFEIEKYSSMGINIITRADSAYPRVLKSKLKDACPPLFYYAGNLALANAKFAGFVGSRSIDEEDEKFTQKIVSKLGSLGFGVVSGGAKGVDSTASSTILSMGGSCIEYLSDSLARKIKKREVINNIQNSRLLLISISKPDAGFNTGFAMQRNKFIYAQSKGTIVVRSDYNKGGTWSGATEALKNLYCPVFCREKIDCLGNMKLINLGAVPISEEWDGNMDVDLKPRNEKRQTSLFDNL